MEKIEIRKVEVLRYLQPLREGGSLPAIVEGDDEFLYVMKFRGAGQGKKALVAELIGGEIARKIGLQVPELVFLHLDESFSITEGDEEIQDLLKFSIGLNLGLHFLSGSITYDPLVSNADSLSASKVVLLDSIINNIDRTAKNTNLLNWNKELWLIDHGASLYFHHNWPSWEQSLGKGFFGIKDHVLLSKASELVEAAEIIKDALHREVLEEIVSIIPEEWLEDETSNMNPAERRAAYLAFLEDKIKNIPLLLKEAEDARKGNI
ncbi:MAG: HipA family kinase [Saprospiraceae bacterium]